MFAVVNKKRVEQICSRDNLALHLVLRPLLVLLARRAVQLPRLRLRVVLVQQLALSQYEVVRLDPFRHVSHTLHVYTVTTCDWDTMALTCPLGTKV